MQVQSHRSPSVLAFTLVVLFFVLSFNAYACLVPVNGVMPAPMANGCGTPDEQPVSQYCDAFTTLGVQSADKLPLNSATPIGNRSEEHTSELQSQSNLVCRLLLEKK